MPSVKEYPRVRLHRFEERFVVLLGLGDRSALALVAAEDVLLLLGGGPVASLDSGSAGALTDMGCLGSRRWADGTGAAARPP